MQKSDQINDLATALSKAQGEMKGALKDSSNPFFKSKYADLASVWEAFREPFAKNGLSLIQLPSMKENQVCVESVLLHASGQWISEVLSAQPKDASPQAVGSTITYLRRYGAQSIAGVCPEDDDGNAASGQTIKVEYITESQGADLDALIDEVKADKVAFCKYFKIESINKLPVTQFKQAIAMVEAKRKQPVKAVK